YGEAPSIDEADILIRVDCSQCSAIVHNLDVGNSIRIAGDQHPDSIKLPRLNRRVIGVPIHDVIVIFNTYTRTGRSARQCRPVAYYASVRWPYLINLDDR